MARDDLNSPGPAQIVKDGNEPGVGGRVKEPNRNLCRVRNYVYLG